MDGLRTWWKNLTGPSLVTFGSILDMVLDGSNNAEERLGQLYSWRVDRRTTAVKGSFATAALLLAAYLPAVFMRSVSVLESLLVLVPAFSFAVAGTGLYVTQRRLMRAYLMSLAIYDMLKSVAEPLAKVYDI